MEVNVTKERVIITSPVAINSNEYMVNTCKFILPQSFQGLTVTAVFNKIPVPLTGDTCYIPALEKGTATVGVYAYEYADDGIKLMYSPSPATFFVCDGSYSTETAVEELPSITEFEKYCAAVTALTFPKSDVISEFDDSTDYDDTKVFSVGALRSVLSMFSNEMENLRAEAESIESKAEKIINKATIIGASSTDFTYPSSKAVADYVATREAVLNQSITAVSGSLESTDTRVDDVLNRINDINNGITEVNSNISNNSAEISALNSALESGVRELNSKITENASGITANENSIAGINTELGELKSTNENTELVLEEMQSDIELNSQSISQLENQLSGGIFGYANALKGSASGVGSVAISDLSPLKQELEISLSSETLTDFSGVTVTAECKNLLGISGRTLTPFGYSGSGSVRSLNGESIYLAVAGSNVYKHNSGYYKYNESKGTLTCGVVYAYYGPAFDIAVEPSTSYAISVEEFPDNGLIFAAFYNSAGEYISSDTLKKNGCVTSPENAVWMLVGFSASVNNTTVSFSKIQVEKATAVTEYMPYFEAVTATASSDGSVEGFVCNGTYIKIVSSNGDVQINVEYNRDINTVINSLIEAVGLLGGSV